MASIRRPLRSRRALPEGQHFDPRFISPQERARIVAWLGTLHPLMEQRYPARRTDVQQRALLRPVYWLGNWQFACLDYYRPPLGVLHRCVRAEPFPPELAFVSRIEERVREDFDDVPAGWHLNTCLVNLYGSRGGRDLARVGEHKDFEPGPVASVSFGERALFQFVRSSQPGSRDEVVSQTWLSDCSLQIFGGDRWKKQLFHRVQRVEDHGARFKLNVAPDFETRRVNLTFRYVPDEHIARYRELPAEARGDIEGYMKELARYSNYYAEELAAAR